MALLLIVAIVVVLLVLNKKTTTPNDNEMAYTKIVIEINPKVLLEIDSNGNVVNVYPLNDDAKIFTEDLLKGKNIEEATKIVVETAKSNGYLTDNELKVYVFDNEKDEVYTKVITELKNNGITPTEVTITETEQKEIEKTTEEIINNQSTNPVVDPVVEEPKKEETPTTFTVTFNSNGGSKVSSVTVNAGEKVSKPKTPTKSGYTFSSWKLDGSAYNFTSAVTKDITLVAEWKEIKYDYNLNNNVSLTDRFAEDETYIYPHNAECIGKYPGEVTLPEGQNYDTYCENTIPSLQSTIKGKGYVCTLVKGSSTNFKTSGSYECHVLTEIISLQEVQKIINKKKVNSYALAISGGRGGEEPITLTEEVCTKFSLSCGRW